jgi:hypothetical protein
MTDGNSPLLGWRTLVTPNITIFAYVERAFELLVEKM